MDNVVSIILGGGRGTRLFPLTSIRSKPAVPLAAKYRLIDIPISNCINSGIQKIYVLTQFMSASLHAHIRGSYVFDQFSGGFVEILAAQQTMDKGTDWFEGTADAVRKTLRYIEQDGIDYVIILSGDQLYRMDYAKMIRAHYESGADATISGIPVDREAAKGFGIMRLDDEGTVKGFVEKPSTEEDIAPVLMSPDWISSQGVEPHGRDCIASMGIYVFNRDTLVDLLKGSDYRDFGKEVFPEAINKLNVKMYLFDGYWEDIGTIRSFYEANLSLASENPPFNFSQKKAPIYSRARYLPPTKVNSATIKNSLIADGCYIGQGAVIENSVIGLRSIIGPNTTIKDSIVMGCDYYEVDLQRKKSIPLEIQEGTYIEGAIVDKNCRIGKNVRISNINNTVNSTDDDAIVVIRDGIPIVRKSSSIPDDSVF